MKTTTAEQAVETPCNHAQDQARMQLSDIMELVANFEHDEESSGLSNSDCARQAILDKPLSVQIRSDWHDVGKPPFSNGEFCILLCTGGPAVRIMGEHEEGEADSAWIEYQDWGTPWTRLYSVTDEQEAALLSFARHFYFN